MKDSAPHIKALPEYGLVRVKVFEEEMFCIRPGYEYIRLPIFVNDPDQFDPLLPDKIPGLTFSSTKHYVRLTKSEVEKLNWFRERQDGKKDAETVVLKKRANQGEWEWVYETKGKHYDEMYAKKAEEAKEALKAKKAEEK